MADATPQHQAWYGSQPPPGFPRRQPYFSNDVPVRRRRKCGFVYSVVRQFSFVIPVILLIVTAYVYGRDAAFRGETPGAGDPVWVPLYLTIPLSAVNIIWNFAVMVNHRRAPHRGRPFSQELLFLVELTLTVGAIVCFIFMVVVLTNRGGGSQGRGDLPLPYHRSMAWLLGMQMVASVFLCGRAAVEIWRERRDMAGQETYTIH